jgi:hypothetical protein
MSDGQSWTAEELLVNENGPFVECSQCGSRDTRRVKTPAEKIDEMNANKKELVGRAISGLKRIGTFGYMRGSDPHVLDCTLAGRVAYVFGVGMGRAIALCIEFGEDQEFHE